MMKLLLNINGYMNNFSRIKTTKRSSDKEQENKKINTSTFRRENTFLKLRSFSLFLAQVTFFSFKKFNF